MEISKKEWWFVGKIGLAVAVLAFAPIIAGVLMAPSDKVFTGQQFANYMDTMIYYSNIEQVRDGHFLFKNLYTGEQPSPRFIFDPFWLAVGLVAKIFHFSAFTAYHLARFMLFPFLLVVLYLLAAFFIKEEIKRKIGFIFMVFASGMGTFMIGEGISKADFHSYNIPLDLVTPEAFTFFSIYNSPHFIASLTLLILIFLLSALAFDRYRFGYSLGAGASILFLFQFHPYHVATVFAALGVFILINFIRHRKIKFNYLKHYFILTIFSLPPIFYHFWTVKNVWVRSQHLLQNVTLMPAWPVFLFSFGLLGILAAIGVFLLLAGRQKSEKDIFLLVWAVVQLFLIYSPLPFQRRLVEGFSVALAILAATGLFYLKEKIWQRELFRKYFSLSDPISRRVAFVFLFVIFFFLSSLSVILTDLSLYLKNDQALYMKKSRYEAMSWLKTNTPEKSVIVSLPDTGNIIPAFSLRQAHWGHEHQTAMAKSKMRELEIFFRASDEKGRRAFLKNSGISYLFFSSEEREKSLFDPEKEGYFEKVFSNGEVSIYKVL